MSLCCFSAPEPQVLDFVTQQLKLLPLVAEAWAVTFIGHYLRELYFESMYEINQGNVGILAQVSGPTGVAPLGPSHWVAPLGPSHWVAPLPTGVAPLGSPHWVFPGYFAIVPHIRYGAWYILYHFTNIEQNLLPTLVNATAHFFLLNNCCACN